MKISLTPGETLIIQGNKLTVHVKEEFIFGNEIIIFDFPINDIYRMVSAEYAPETISIALFDGKNAQSLEFDNGGRLERMVADESANPRNES